MKNLRKLWTGCLTFALLASPALAADSDIPPRDVAGWTLLAGHQGETGQLGVRLEGREKATLDVWLDFDGDGFFTEGEERVLDRVEIEPGTSVQPFALPAEAELTGRSRIRMRVTGESGETLMDREGLVFPERVVSPGCNWSPGFDQEGLDDYALALEVFGDDLYVGGNLGTAGGVASNRVARWDGRGWHQVGGNVLWPGDVTALETFDDGSGNGPRLYAGTEFSPFLYRLNGSAWEPVEGLNGRVNALQAWFDANGQPALYVGGQFNRAGSLVALNIARLGRTGWQSLGALGVVNALTVAGQGTGARLYAGGGSGTGFVSSWNGSGWSSHGTPASMVRALREFDNSLYAGHNLGVQVLQGNVWQATPYPAVIVRALAVHDGALYAAGQGWLAKRTGTTWTLLAQNNEDIYALASYGEPEAAPALFAAGEFSTFTPFPSGPAINLFNIARFDGLGFSSLSSGLDGRVLFLATDPDPGNGGDIYATGEFSRAGGVQASRFARWDGRWNAVIPASQYSGTSLIFDGEGAARKIYMAARDDDGDNGAFYEIQGSAATMLGLMNNDARAVAKLDNLVYVGGTFSTVNGANHSRLAAWDGGAWRTVPGAATQFGNGEVNAMMLFDFGQGLGKQLVVAGSFASRVAVKNGSSWSPLGSSLGNPIWALAVHDDGDGEKLYAAGDRIVARWDGAGWTSIAPSLNGNVYTLASFSDGTRPQLAAAGDFTSIQVGVTANRFALWDGGAWSSVGSGFLDVVRTLTASLDRSRLYAGGDFTTASGLASAYIARLDCPAAVVPVEYDAEIAMTSPQTILTAGGGVGYRLEVRNHGPDTAAGLRVDDVFPNGLQSCIWTAQANTTGASGYQNGAGAALRQTLTLPANGQVTYVITCNVSPTASGVLENAATLSPGDLFAGNDRAVVSHVVRPPADLPGDCKKDAVLNTLDFDAFHSEIFDGDGAYPDFTPASTYPGNPVGCNANLDQTVDAGDISCLDRKIAGQPCSTGALPSGGLPQLSMPDLVLVENRKIEVEIRFDPKQQPINTVAFELLLDADKLVLPADLAGAIQLSQPQGALFRKIEGNRIAVVIRQPLGQALAAGRLLKLTLDLRPDYLGDTMQRGVAFSTETPASFGNTGGQSVFGLANLQHEVVHTLVVTNTSRLFGTAGLGFGLDQQAQLRARLDDFLGHDRVNGLLVDLAADPDLRWLYDQWDADKRPAKANAVLFGGGSPARRGLHRLLRQLLADFPAVQHLLIVGDDRIVPFTRLVDGSILAEGEYVGSGGIAGLPDANPSAVKLALADDFFLSDDPLASREALTLDSIGGAADFVLPGLASGRLVETAGDILGAFDTFLERDGLIDLDSSDPQERKVLVAGYDFSTNSAGEIAELWRGALGGSPASAAPVDGRLIGNQWRKADLLASFTAGDSRLYSLNGHASHVLVGSPSGPSFGLDGVPALDLYGADHCGNTSNAPPVDLGGALVVGMSCHGGLPVPGTCSSNGMPSERHTLDLPQAFLAGGALAYGDNSGFGWGLLEGTGLGERLALLIQRRLLGLGIPAVPPVVGAAVRQAKIDYYLQQVEFDSFDRKSLMQWTLYGFPMVELARPQNPAPDAPDGFGHPGAAVSVLQPAPPHLTRILHDVELSAADYHRVELGGEIADHLPCPAAGCYWQLNGLTTDEVDLPMQPFTTFDATLAQTIQRGVLWTGAKYAVEFPFHPVVATPVSSEETVPWGIGSLPIHVYQRPRGPNGGGYLGGPLGCPGNSGAQNQTVLLAGELRQVGTAPVTWEERRYSQILLETLHRSASAFDCEPPIFGAGSFSHNENGELRWHVPVSDAGSGVWRVIAVWDDAAAREWKSVELSPSGGLWVGSLPADPNRPRVTYFVQAVDNEGNVAWREQVVEDGVSLPRHLLEPIAVELPSAPPPGLIFADGFESGDCSRWDTCG